MKKLIGPIHKGIGISLALLLLRIAAGGLMMPHGFGKLERLIDGEHGFYDFLGIGELPSLVLVVFAEFICSALVVAGLFTRLASIPLIVTMAVATFLVHAGDPMEDKEMALLYLGYFISIAILGPGKYSMDHLIKKS